MIMGYETDGQIYEEYFTLALAAAQEESNPDVFFLTHFPYLTDEELELIRLFVATKIHDGIRTGLDICGRDPMGEIEAYQEGVRDGLEQGRNSQ